MPARAVADQLFASHLRQVLDRLTHGGGFAQAKAAVGEHSDGSDGKEDVFAHWVSVSRVPVATLEALRTRYRTIVELFPGPPPLPPGPQSPPTPPCPPRSE